ncbi:hypothetical protein AB0K60_16330 [Thermopolyspora sp. NPDC052614]|uniref:hypothetical protein n=1 Tax=Thermopolyspora sp. NPDC052614 TaxID=3155682 RepID=UPI0034236DCE
MNSVEFHTFGTRRDGDEWIIGRVGSDQFMVIPAEGLRAIELLREGASTREARERLRAETGRLLDVESFVAGLAESGLVARIDGRPIDTPPLPEPTFPRLRPHHVRWTQHLLVHLGLAAVILAGLVVCLLDPGILPGWRTMIWSEHGSLVILGQIALAWLLVLLHEFAHLATARAAGIPGTISLGTRLQFLVAQTNVTGIWLLPFRARATVYLAGMTLDATICAAALVLIFLFGPHPLLSMLVLTELGCLLVQFLLFMRTDIYFLLQDLTGCRNLYGDSTAYLRHLISMRGHPDPLARLPKRERVSIRAYTVLLVAGTAASLAFAAAVTLPLLISLVATAAGTLMTGPDLIALLDATAVLALTTGMELLWARAWLRRHGHRIRALLSRKARPPATTADRDLPGTSHG